MVNESAKRGGETHHATWRVYRNDTHQLVGTFAAGDEQSAITLAAQSTEIGTICEIGRVVGIHGTWFYAILEPV